MERNVIMDDVKLNDCFCCLVNKYKEKNVVLIDSLYAEKNKFNIRTFRKRIIHPKKVVFVPFFIRGTNPECSHWLSIMIDQRKENVINALFSKQQYKSFHSICDAFIQRE